MIILGVYTIYAILSYSTNYLTEMYGMDAGGRQLHGHCHQQNLSRHMRPARRLITIYTA